MRDGSQKHPLYQTWRGMLRRCEKPTATGYKNYGGRGIEVCERWHNFWMFIEDIGPKPGSDYQLERKNNDGNYEPGNVKWATTKEQTRNARYNKPMTVAGTTKIMSDWANGNGIPKSTLFNRLKRGLSHEQAIMKPIQFKADAGSVVPLGARAIALERGIKIETLHSQIGRGWSLHDALNAPVGPQHGGNYGTKIQS